MEKVFEQPRASLKAARKCKLLNGCWYTRPVELGLQSVHFYPGNFSLQRDIARIPFRGRSLLLSLSSASRHDFKGLGVRSQELSDLSPYIPWPLVGPSHVTQSPSSNESSQLATLRRIKRASFDLYLRMRERERDTKKNISDVCIKRNKRSHFAIISSLLGTMMIIRIIPWI